MKIVQWHHKPLKLSTPLMWVEEFEFTTSLKLEECYVRLASGYNSDGQKRYYVVKEVLWDGEVVYFWLGMSRRYGRYRGYSSVIGKLSCSQLDGQVYAHCYVGQPMEFFVIVVSLLFWLFLFFYVVYGRVERIALLMGILLSAIPSIFLIWSDKNQSEEVRGELKYYCHDLFKEPSPLRRYPFKL